MRVVELLGAVVGVAWGLGLGACAGEPARGQGGDADVAPRGEVQQVEDATEPADGGSDAQAPLGAYVFPPGFLFGTAVAGFQVDMGCPTLPAETCEDPNSDWYQFITSEVTRASGLTHLAGHPPSAGPGFWELYEADLDRAAEALHTNAFRFSLEWSRLFPSATDGLEDFEAMRAAANPAALAHYHAILDAALARGLTPLVTLNHYTLPTWIHDGPGCHADLGGCSPRGWLDAERTVAEISKFAAFAAREFGGKVDRWATLNEPFAVLLPGYIFPSADRTNPPARMLALDEAKVVFAALVEAHARMYDAVKAADTVDADGDGAAALVGVVYGAAATGPKDPDREVDRVAAEHVFYLWNMAYLNAVVLGQFDGDLDGTAVARADLQGRMDYLGINYYTRSLVGGTEAPVLPDLSPLTTFNPLGISAFNDDPQGLHELLMRLTAAFPGVPIVITENGSFAPEDNGPEYVVQHLAWLWRALRDGADVRGYFYWTLLDNYEWNHGMNIRMGLYAVGESQDKPRTARPHAAVYARIARDGAIPADLMEQYGPPEGSAP